MASFRKSYIFELECDPPVYAWTGHGKLQLGGKTYLGTGGLIEIPDLKQLINGAADRMDVTISGVDEDGLRLIQEDRITIPQSDARIGRVSFDVAWQVDGAIEWLWYGTADSILIGSSNSGEGRTRTVKLGMASGDTRRANPQIAFFTDADQRKRSPDDAFFSHVGQITTGITREFGPK